MPSLDIQNPPIDPSWAKSKIGRFHFFCDLDPEEEGLEKVSGVYIIWHGGVRPEWVHIGKSDDLAATFHELGKNEEIMEYEVNGRLYVSWSLILPKYQDAVLRYLTDALKPVVENLDSLKPEVVPLPVFAPGHAAKEHH